MGKNKGGDWDNIILVAAGAVGVGFLIYLLAGRGKENDAALIPNKLEDQIDFVVEKLNNRFGKWWVNQGLNALQAFLQSKMLPPH